MLTVPPVEPSVFTQQMHQKPGNRETESYRPPVVKMGRVGVIEHHDNIRYKKTNYGH